MIDVEDVDNLFGVIDPVADAVLTSPRTPLARKRWSERSADSTRVVSERTEQELDARSSNSFG